MARARTHERNVALHAAIWIAVSTVAAGWAAVTSRDAMNPDGIAYLDMAEAWSAGRWSEAVDAYWSPLYTWILGLVFFVFPPGLNDFRIAHAVNWAIFILGLAGVTFLVRELNLARPPAQDPPLPRHSILAVGYSIFLWAGIRAITLGLVNPDLLTAALILFAGGLLLRYERSGHRRGIGFGCGLCLGAAYLSKAALFPISCVLLAAMATHGLASEFKLRRFAPVLSGFVIAAAVWIVPLSVAAGRPTIGEAGRLNFIWFSNDVPGMFFQGNRANGVPDHPPRLIHRHPDIFEFSAPFSNVTYAIWSKPAYWYEGVRARLTTGFFSGAAVKTSVPYFIWFAKELAPLAASTLLLLVTSWRDRTWRRPTAAVVYLLVFASAAVILYALVHFEPRFVGGFVVLGFITLLSTVGVPPPGFGRALSICAVAALILVPVISVGRQLLSSELLTGPGQFTRDSALGALAGGLLPGDGIVAVGSVFPESQDDPFYFARLARVRIVAEVPDGEVSALFHQGDWRQTLAKTRRYGARAAVIRARDLPNREGWRQLGQGPFWMSLLDE